MYVPCGEPAFLTRTEWTCGEPIWCASTWPHATGNYGGEPPPENAIIVPKPRYYHLKGGAAYKVKGQASDEFTNGPFGQPHIVIPESHLNGSVEATPEAEGQKCCRPTLECWNHINDAKRFFNKDDDDLYILDFDDWQKAVCCLLDYTQPKTNCVDPDDVLPIRWYVWLPISRPGVSRACVCFCLLVHASNHQCSSAPDERLLTDCCRDMPPVCSNWQSWVETGG